MCDFSIICVWILICFDKCFYIIYGSIANGYEYVWCLFDDELVYEFSLVIDDELFWF